MAKKILRSGAALGASLAAVAGVGLASATPAESATYTHRYQWTVKYYPYKTVTRYTDKLPYGQRKVAVSGVTGVRSWLWWQKLRDGKVAARYVAGGKVLRAPRWRIVLVGTHVPTRYAWTVSYHPYKTVTRYTNKLPYGQRKVAVSGVTGVRSWLWYQKLRDGKVAARYVAGGKVLRAPRWRVVLIGTRKSTVYHATPARGASCIASYYHEPQNTASGEWFNPNAMTAAHKTMPLGSRVKVSANGRTVVVRINDRGPYIGGRCLDLSRRAFDLLGNLNSGTMRVTYQRVS